MTYILYTMENNKRKTLKGLSTIGVLSLTGCLDRLNPTQEQDFNSDEQITISLSSVAQNPVTRYDLNFNVEIEKEIADEESPPSIIVSVTNKDSTEIILSGKTRSVFGGEDDIDGDISLLETNEWTKEQMINSDCWRLREEMPRPGTAYETILRENESESVELNVIGHPNASGCIPTGGFRFETNYELILPDVEGNEVIEEFTWGFILDISKETI